MASEDTPAVAALIERMERNEAEAAEIRAEAETLGLDAKKIKTIRKARADAEAARRTYEALIAEKIITKAQARTLGGEA